jgi:hypothetical protein
MGSRIAKSFTKRRNHARTNDLKLAMNRQQTRTRVSREGEIPIEHRIPVVFHPALETMIH